jgi:hypothetical protein
MTGVLDCLTVRIGVEVSQSNIQSKSLTRGLSLLYPFLVKEKLNVVPISSTNNTHSLASASTGIREGHEFPTS